MTDSDRTKYLRIALLLVGPIFIVGIYPLTIIWPSGWSWNTGQWRHNLWRTPSTSGDVFMVAIVLALFTPRGAAERAA